MKYYKVDYSHEDILFILLHIVTLFQMETLSLIDENSIAEMEAG